VALDSLRLVNINKGFEGKIIRFTTSTRLDGMNTTLEIKCCNEQWEIKKHVWGCKTIEKRKKILWFHWIKTRHHPLFYTRTAVCEDNIPEVFNDLLSLGITSINDSKTLHLQPVATDDSTTYTIEYAEPQCHHTASYTNPELLDTSFIEVHILLKLIPFFENKFDILPY
jgi:hypothetical protein